MLEVSTEDITEGSLLGPLVVLAVPLLVQNVVQVLQQVIDIVFLGRVSGDAVAAVGLVTPLLGLMFAGVFVTFVGTQVVVSRRVGATDRAGARTALYTGLVMALGVGVVVGGLMAVAAGPLLRALSMVRPESGVTVTELAVQYLSVLALGLPIMAVTDTVEGGFVGHGDSRASLYMNGLALCGNIVLDPLLIFGLGPFPRLGITGAALATVLGSLAGVVLGFVLIARGRNDGMLTRERLGIERETTRGILSIGAPVGGQQAARQLLRLPVYLLVFLAAGGAGLAAYTIGARVASIAFVPPQGLQQAAQSVVGQNLGAERPDRARLTVWLGVGVASGALLVVGLSQWIAASPLALAFAPTLSSEALSLTIEYLRILAIGYPALGAIYLFEAGFNAADRSRISFLSTVMQYGTVRLPIAAAGVLLLGGSVTSVFWAVTVSNVAAALWLAWYYESVGDGLMGRAAAVAQ
mgnify:FL=1